MIYENYSLHMPVFGVFKEYGLCLLLLVDEDVLVDAVRYAILVHVLHR